MRLLWDESAWEDYCYWQTQDKKTLKKINALVKDIDENSMFFFVLTLAGTCKPGGEIEESASMGYDVIQGTGQDEAYVTTGNIIATLTAVSATSKHPEETLKYLELLNTDPYVMNLVSYGIEGKHYEKVSEKVAERMSKLILLLHRCCLMIFVLNGWKFLACVDKEGI